MKHQFWLCYLIGWLIINLLSVQAQVNITTYKNDLAHTGQNLAETILTPANVAKSGNFGLLFNQTLDGQVYAEPLYLSGIKFPDGNVHNVIFVATQHDSVYAFDADSNTGANASPLWHTSFLSSPTNPEAGVTYTSDGNYTILTGANAVDPNDKNYANTSDITVEIGITTTPVIDPATSTLYVVSKSSSGTGSTTQQYLHALDVTTGKDKVPRQLINPTFVGNGTGNVRGAINFDPLREHLRSSMVLYNGVVYLAYASHSDQGNYHGMILGYNASTLAYTKSFIVTPNGSEGGIWAAGCGPAVDGSGNMFVSTGNGSFDQAVSSGFDWSESFLKLPTTGTFNVNNLNTDFFTPNNQASLTSRDADLGSSGLLLLPDQSGPHTHLMISGGKADVMYVVDRDIMGGNVPSNQADKVVQEINENHRLFCSPSYFNGYVYYAPENSHLLSRKVGYNSATGNYVSTNPISSVESFSAHGSSAFISAHGNQNGIVWIINDAIPSILYAYDATAFSTSATSPVGSIFNYPLIYNTGSATINDSANKFTLPTIANGKVYLTAYDPPATTSSTKSDPHPTTVGHLYVLGLLNSVTSIPTAPSNLVTSVSSSSQITLSWKDNSNNESGFKILRSTQASGPFSQVGLAGANITTYSDGNLNPQTTYYYEVTATNSLGDSSPSNVASAATFAPYTPPGLLAYWNFDEGSGTTVADVTDHGYTGTLNGEVGFIPGFIGNAALNFHGTGNAVANVTVTDTPTLRFAANQSFTLSAWILQSATRTTDEGVICKSRDTGNYYGIWINASNNQWVFRGPQGDLVGPTATSAWTHVAAVQDGVAGKRYLYINGILAATGSAQAGDGTGDLWFGQAKSVEQPFPGNIDEVRLYNRALAPSEITTLMGPPVLEALSLQNQGSSGTYGLVLPINGTIIDESREGASSGTYQLTLTFSSPVSGITASLGLQNGGTAVGKISSITYNSVRNVATVNLTGVGNAQKLNLHLSGIVPGNGTADIPFNVLWGDADGNGIVNQEDIALEQSNFSTSVTTGTSSYDFNCDGQINATDVGIETATLGSHLGTLPNYWSNRDIGTVGLVGSASFANGVYTLNGSGADIWNTSDSFHYAYQSLTGDGTIIAHLLTQAPGQDKSGVMIRQDLTAESPYVQLAIHQNYGAKFEYRTTEGAEAVNPARVTTQKAPVWFKLSRVGNVFTSYLSPDGITWTQVGDPTSITMSPVVYIGLSECAHNNSVIGTSTFDQVAVVPTNLWSSQDIGSTLRAGTSIFDNGTSIITASGADIWNASDDFHYTFQTLTGDGTLMARVLSVQNANGWSKAGVMMRASLSPSSIHAMVVVTPANGVAFQYRPVAGGSSVNKNTGGSIKAPCWVRLSRSGNTFTGSYSLDGTTWTVLSTATMSNMPATVYAGLAVTSHNTNATSTAVFTNVSQQ